MDPLNVLQAVKILDIFRVMLVVLLGVYTVFAGLMMKQIGAMTKAVTMKDDFLVRLLGIIHFVFATIVLFAAIILL